MKRKQVKIKKILAEKHVLTYYYQYILKQNKINNKTVFLRKRWLQFKDSKKP